MKYIEDHRNAVDLSRKQAALVVPRRKPDRGPGRHRDPENLRRPGLLLSQNDGKSIRTEGKLKSQILRDSHTQ